jgi:hypothetical protein
LAKLHHAKHLMRQRVLGLPFFQIARGLEGFVELP